MEVNIIFTAQEIFNLACDLISKRQANGTIDGGKTAIYRARALGILTLWQNEIELLLSLPMSDPITDLVQEITVVDRTSGPYYLASKLILVEDPASANFFEQKSDDNIALFAKRQKATEIAITDVYGWNAVNPDG